MIAGAEYHADGGESALKSRGIREIKNHKI